MKRALKKLNILMLAAALIVLAGCSGTGGSDPEPVMGDGFYLDTVCSISMTVSGAVVIIASTCSRNR